MSHFGFRGWFQIRNAILNRGSVEPIECPLDEKIIIFWCLLQGPNIFQSIKEWIQFFNVHLPIFHPVSQSEDTKKRSGDLNQTQRVLNEKNVTIVTCFNSDVKIGLVSVHHYHSLLHKNVPICESSDVVRYYNSLKKACTSK